MRHVTTLAFFAVLVCPALAVCSAAGPKDW